MLISQRVRRSCQLAILASAVTGVLPFWGCQEVPVFQHQQNIARTQWQEPIPIVGSEPPSDRIFIPLQQRQPVKDAALTRARMSRDQIENEVRSKSLVATAATAPAATQPESSAPPQAVKFYLQGREKYLEGANAEAIELLDKALRLDPQAFDVLKLMGQVCFANNQVARSSLYLQRAWNLQPDDIEVNALLGQYWGQRREWPTAIGFFLNAEKSPLRTVNSPAAPLNSFYLAGSFQQAGFYRQAAAGYEDVISMLAEPVASYRYDRDLNFLSHESWALHFAAAENYFVSHEWSRALAHYLEAANEKNQDSYILSRIVACRILLNDNQAGMQKALELLNLSAGNEESQDLALWAYDMAGRESQLIHDLKKLLNAQTTGAGPVMALARIQERAGKPDEALKTLKNFVLTHPDQTDVLQPLIRLSQQQHHPEVGFDILATWLARNPEKSPDAREMLLSLVSGPDEKTMAQQLINEKSPAGNSFAHAYLQGVLAKKLNQDEVCLNKWSQAVALNAGFWQAREAYVSQLIWLARYAEAQSQLQAAINADQGGIKAYLLLIDLALDQENIAGALETATRAKKMFAGNADIGLALGTVYRIRGQYSQSQEEFRNIISTSPQNEAAYKGLIDTSLLAGDGETIFGTLRNLLSLNPTSVYGQVVAIQITMQTGRAADAETMARRLYSQRPRDPEAASLLARAQKAAGNTHAAIATLQDFLHRQQSSPIVTQTLADIYQDSGRTAEALELAKKSQESQPDTAAWRMVYASVLQQAKQPGDAEKVLREGILRDPKSAELESALTDLLSDQSRWADAIAVKKAYIAATRPTPRQLYALSHLYQRADDNDNAVLTLRQLLKAAPYHAGANNDLGYFLAERNENLPEAQTMVQRAVDAMPNNPAFMDSLGWVAYKQGRFKDSVDALQSAVNMPQGRDPQLLAHLGDALVRIGNLEQARQSYEESLKLIRNISADKQIKEIRDLAVYLEQILEQLNNGQKPSVTPIAGKPPSARPATQKTTS